MSRPKTVLFILPTFSQTIEQRVCMGVQDVLNGQDVSVLYVPIGYLPETVEELSHYQWLHEKLAALKPDALMVYGGGLGYRSGPSILETFLDVYGDVPTLNVGNLIEGLPSIEVDNYQGMRELMQLVVRRKPSASYLFFSGPEKNQDSILRLQAFKDAFEAEGLDYQDVDLLVGDYTPSVAQELFEEYLDRVDRPADVIVCANDLTAKGVFDALSKTNYTCPEDVWVTGFDDFEYAASMQPGLSTVHFPARNLGSSAARALLRMLDGETLEGLVETVESYPILRGSTGDAHPGLGDHEHELRQQWAMVALRDTNARKLNVLRSVNRQHSLDSALAKSRSALMDLSVKEFSVFVQSVHSDGISYFTEHALDGRIEETKRTDIQLPKAFYEPADTNSWVLCALEIESLQYGYVIAQSDLVVAEFVEFIAPQITEMLHTESLEADKEKYREQNELNDRMASLGSLVSGVAHEVNTPIGTGKLAASSLKESIRALKKKVEAQTLSRSDFDVFMAETSEYSDIIFNSLDRAAELVTNFKMVSVDQSAEVKRRFDLGEYIESVLSSLRHQIKSTQVKLDTRLADDIEVETFPGAVAQVITNLFMNAVKHGFDGGQDAGKIVISLKKSRSGFVLTFKDNGKGTTPDVLNHVFDPFFTTARGSGGSGLGMHIVFNLVTQKLGWTIQLESEPNKGFKATIRPAS